MKKRLIALLLVLVTVLGMLPATALAADSEEEALGEVNKADRYIRVKASQTADPPRSLFAERAITIQPESRRAICWP